jgi:hypothetical protein
VNGRYQVAEAFEAPRCNRTHTTDVNDLLTYTEVRSSQQKNTLGPHFSAGRTKLPDERPENICSTRVINQDTDAVITGALGTC